MRDRVFGWWLFYKTFAPAQLIITLCGCVIYYLVYDIDGNHDVLPVIVVKMLSNTVIYYAVNRLSIHKLVFFYNLHYSRRELWTMAFSVDAVVLAVLLLMIQALP